MDLELEMSNLNRENVRLLETIIAALKGHSDSDTSILGSLGILKALRQGSENDPVSMPASRGAAHSKVSRSKTSRNKIDTGSMLSSEDRDSIMTDSPVPGPSPKVFVSSQRVVKSNPSRASSAPREPSVKVEEGLESAAELPRGTAVRTEKLLLLTPMQQRNSGSYVILMCSTGQKRDHLVSMKRMIRAKASFAPSRISWAKENSENMRSLT